MNDKQLAEELFRKVALYNIEGLQMIRKAYKIAYKLHDGTKRQSGEPYIIHPIWVALILAELKADTDTICAALLHDTVEDTEYTIEEIQEEFNKDVAVLVDGVTKINKMHFYTKEEERDANIRKLLKSVMVDIRIIMIKIADRLHNMRTLEYKSEFKQKEKSIETMDIYVKLAYRIGAYRIMHELQDLSFYYINHDLYEEYEQIYNSSIEKNHAVLTSMKNNITNILKEENIDTNIKLRTKNVYGIYARMSKGASLSDIHDLNVLKIMVKEIDDCYRTLRYIHQEYHPINNRFKDYICSPKTNMYQSLHTTVFGENDLLVQVQIRTNEMDEVASFGLATYWNNNGINARDKMQSAIKEKYQFYKTLENIDNTFESNEQFVEIAKKELFAKNIYVYSNKGDVIELPVGSTVIDYAYKISDELGNHFLKAYVNDEEVPKNYKLKDNDIVKIETNSLAMPKEEWASLVKTDTAKTHILKYTKDNI